MENIENFSDAEIDNLRNALGEIDKELQINPSSKELLISKPLSFLKKFKIKIIDYFNESKELVRRFTSSINELFKNINSMANQCIVCKLGVILLCYSILGKAKIGWDLTKAAIDKVAEMASKLLHKTSKQATKLVEWLDSINKLFSTSELALRICQYHNLCHDVF